VYLDQLVDADALVVRGKHKEVGAQAFLLDLAAQHLQHSLPLGHDLPHLEKGTRRIGSGSTTTIDTSYTAL
jgi:hypothetical protein